MREHNIIRYNLQEIDILIARRIRERRLELNLTQQELADRLGVTRGNITQFEMGRNKIKHNTLSKLAEILEKPVAYFMSEDDKYYDDAKLKSNPEEIQKILKTWKMKKFLEEKNISKEFIKDLELTIEYLCELYNVDFKEIWK